MAPLFQFSHVISNKRQSIPIYIEKQYYFLFPMYYLFLLIYIYILSYPLRKGRDLFSPTSIWSILIMFYSVPFLLIAFSSRVICDENVLSYCGRDYDYYLCLFMFNQSLFSIFYYYAFNRFSSIKKNEKEKKTIWSIPVSKKICGTMFPILYGIALSMVAYFLFSFGGLLILINALGENRGLIKDDNQIFLSLASFFVCLGSIFHIKYLSYCTHRVIGIIICLVIGFIVVSIGGGRGPFLTYVITVGICYTYFIHKFKIFSLKLLPLYFSIIIFFIGMLGLRISAGSDFGEMIESNFLSVFSGNSYVDIQVATEKYFEGHDFWAGKTFSKPHHIFALRSIVPDKRPIDDGVYYFAAFFEGGEIFNRTDFSNSWPPGTLGSMYANFGYIGIIMGAILLAYIHNLFFKLFNNNKRNILTVYLYSFVIVKFQLTYYYYANLVYLIIYLFLFILVFKFFYSFRPSRFIKISKKT